MKNSYSAEENNLIISMVAECKSNREIAEKLKRTYPAITQKIFELRSLGHIPPVNRNKYTMCAPSEYPLATENPETSSGIALDEIPGEVEFYKEQLAVAEAALEKRTRELFIERQSNAELRILARMIAKAVDV